MSEKINIKKSYESSVGNTASEFSEINKRKTFSQREVGLNHPDNPGFIRLTDSGDIEIFAAPGVGLVINGTTKTVSIFAENIINLCKKAQKNAITLPIISQLIRSGTSIGANYCEANGASSRKDFKNKIFICKKESKETVL